MDKIIIVLLIIILIGIAAVLYAGTYMTRKIDRNTAQEATGEELKK